MVRHPLFVAAFLASITAPASAEWTYRTWREGQAIAAAISAAEKQGFKASPAPQLSEQLLRMDRPHEDVGLFTCSGALEAILHGRFLTALEAREALELDMVTRGRPAEVKRTTRETTYTWGYSDSVVVVRVRQVTDHGARAIRYETQAVPLQPCDR